MKPKPFTYYKAALRSATTLLETASLKEFHQLLHTYQYRTLFTLTNAAEAKEYFAVLHQGAMIQQPTEGYRNLEDYLAATEQGFESAATYYEATGQGYGSQEDYRLVQEAGITSREVLEKVKAAGFAEGYAAYMETAGNQRHPDYATPGNAYELYESAGASGFDTYDELMTGLKAGFTEGSKYRLARSRGFTDAATFEAASGKGFLSQQEYAFALEHSIMNQQDAVRYTELTLMSGPEDGHDKKLLLDSLSKLEQGKRISVNKLYGHLQQRVPDYYYDAQGILPPWFKTSINSTDDLIAFLEEDKMVRQYSVYDKDGEFIEVSRTRERKIVIDGSNVAHSTAEGNKDEKPTFANIIRMVEHLRAQGCEEITVISDASLKHRIADKAALPQLEAAAHYLEAPAESSADAFLIDFVKHTRALVVTNDTFRDWKMRDPWVAQNIDYYRVSFMVKDGLVLTPDL